MSAPTAPTLTTLTTEALKKAGYSSPSPTMLTRAQDEWMNEIKNDIWLKGKKLKSLMAAHIEILNGGKSQYNFPSGFSSIHTAEILYGDECLDVTGGAAATVTLDSTDESQGEDDIEGREIVIYSGTGKGGVAQCYSYNENTYVASVSPAWTTVPVSGDTYFTVDEVIPLDLKSVQHYRQISEPYEKGAPKKLYQVGSEYYYGYYHLFPVPDDDHYYACRINYFIDLLTLDLAGTRMATLYQRWRNLWIQGVYARQLSDDDDSRALNEMARYYTMVKDTVALETYGRDIKPTFIGVSA